MCPFLPDCGHTSISIDSLKNRLLASIPQDGRERLLAEAKLTTFKIKTDLFRRGEVPRWVYFPLTSMASVVFTSTQGATVEQEAIGCEGLVGWPFVLGEHEGLSDSLVQIAGDGLCIPLAAVVAEFADSPVFHARVLEFVRHQSTLSSQLAACNRLHEAEARLARWLLMVQDRIERSALEITQEFLSNMLGTRRTTVTEVSGTLEKVGAVQTGRGVTRILDRTLLEQRACECYRLLRPRYDALYSAPLE